MATAPNSPPPISLAYGKPEVLTLKYVTGKNIGNSKQPPFLPRVMFSAEEGPLFLDAEDASDFETQIRDLAISPGDPVTVTKIKLARGGGHSIRVARASDRVEASPAAPAGGPNVAAGPARPLTDAEAEALFGAPDRTIEALLEKSIEMARSLGPAPPVLTPACMKLCACLMAAVDAALECETYASRKGMELRFSSEDIRTMANTLGMNGGIR